MSYIDVIPKDLYNLLERYANYQHWQCLNAIFFSLSTTGYVVSMYEKIKFGDCIRQLEKLLPDCRINTLTEVQPSWNFSINIRVILPINKLVTKNLLFQTLFILFQDISTSYNTSRESINNWLKNYLYSERLAVVPLFSGEVITKVIL
jgi:hypothetical protein